VQWSNFFLFPQSVRSWIFKVCCNEI
jgi:hypothetical protein